jgi:hypothetical protein
MLRHRIELQRPYCKAAPSSNCLSCLSLLSECD